MAIPLTSSASITIPPEHGLGFASAFHRHSGCQAESPCALGLEMQEIPGVQDASIDFAVKGIVQSLDPTLELKGLVGFPLRFAAIRVNHADHPENQMLRGAARFLGLSFNPYLSPGAPFMAEVAMVLWQVDRYGGVVVLEQESFIEPFGAHVKGLNRAGFLHGQTSASRCPDDD